MAVEVNRRYLIMKITAAQISCTPGDLDANVRKIRDFASLAKDGGAEVILT